MLIDREWYERNKNRITEEKINSLGIEISVDGRNFPPIYQEGKRGNVKKLVKNQIPN